MIWLLPILSAIFWRMGGAAGYDKLWRRIGSSLCILMPLFLIPISLLHIVAVAMVLWGSWSYFGWLTPGDIKERWFNYLAAACMTQGAAVALGCSWWIALIFAFLSAIGKVLIDNSNLKSKDVISELFYGFFICLGVVVNWSCYSLC